MLGNHRCSSAGIIVQAHEKQGINVEAFDLEGNQGWEGLHADEMRL
jgi:hypothetical protein